MQVLSLMINNSPKHCLPDARSNPLSLPISTDPAGGAVNCAGGRRYNYLFFIDFEGSTAEEPVQNALKNLEEFATYLRVLGSYPMAV